MALRPEKIRLSAQRPDAAHAVSGKIIDIAYEGDRSLYRIMTESRGVMLVSTTNVTRTRDGIFRRDQSVWLGWNDDSGQVLDE